MINADLHYYDYYTIASNDYGQPTIGSTPHGRVKLAIYNTTQQVQDNILYRNASYIALTADKDINDTFVIQYGDTKLKVLYVQPQGRLKQVFLQNVN